MPVDADETDLGVAEPCASAQDGAGVAKRQRAARRVGSPCVTRPGDPGVVAIEGERDGVEDGCLARARVARDGE